MDINRFVVMLMACCCRSIRNSVHELKPFQGNVATEIRKDRPVMNHKTYFDGNYKRIGSYDDSIANDNGKNKICVNITNQ